MSKRQENGPKVGVSISTRIAKRLRTTEPAGLLACCQAAESAGVYSVWVEDSFLARPRFEPLTFLAADAPATCKVALGTTVLVPALRHPLCLAHAAARVDRISGGQLVPGVGVGFNYPLILHELESIGVPFGQRVGRTVETIGSSEDPGPLKVRSISKGIIGASRTLNSFRAVRIRVGRPYRWVATRTTPYAEPERSLIDGFRPVQTGAVQGRLETGPGSRTQRNRAVERIETATLATIDVNTNERLAADDLGHYMESYYSTPYQRLGCCSGTGAACSEWLDAFRRAGPQHSLYALVQTIRSFSWNRSQAESYRDCGIIDCKGVI